MRRGCVLALAPRTFRRLSAVRRKLDVERSVTAEQAKNGERAYQAQCATCHGADLHSTEPEAPDLTEGAFSFGWQGKTIANRFEQIRNTMPLGKPRNLDDQTYLDIVCYILQFNGIPPGNQKLVPDGPTLERIVITIP